MTITKGRERMYTVKNVLFEQLKTIPKRVMVLGILYFFFPFLCLCGMGIPEVRNVLLSGPELLDNIVQALLVGGLILWAPAGFIFLIVTRKRGVGAYKYYPNCPDDCRFEIETTFDFESQPGEVFCIIRNPANNNAPYKQPVKEFQYDHITKVLLYVWNTPVTLVPGGKNLVQPSARFFTGAIISPYSEELIDLILKNDINDSISIKKLDTKAANYIEQAVKEKR